MDPADAGEAPLTTAGRQVADDLLDGTDLRTMVPGTADNEVVVEAVAVVRTSCSGRSASLRSIPASHASKRPQG